MLNGTTCCLESNSLPYNRVSNTLTTKLHAFTVNLILKQCRMYPLNLAAFVYLLRNLQIRWKPFGKQVSFRSVSFHLNSVDYSHFSNTDRILTVRSSSRATRARKTFRRKAVSYNEQSTQAKRIQGLHNKNSGRNLTSWIDENIISHWKSRQLHHRRWSSYTDKVLTTCSKALDSNLLQMTAHPFNKNMHAII